MSVFDLYAGNRRNGSSTTRPRAWSGHANLFEFKCLRAVSRGSVRGLLVLTAGVPVALHRGQQRRLVVRRPTGRGLAVDELGLTAGASRAQVPRQALQAHGDDLAVAVPVLNRGELGNVDGPHVPVQLNAPFGVVVNNPARPLRAGVARETPRCNHPGVGNGSKPNRLAGETSPYLLQHAHNPVEWYPWGEEAFARARAENRPIMLSVGYSACHWCHVMERESFENEDTARLMNELFVNVKVDREERPDVDDVYMRAVQMLTGRGGWPMTVFLTPDGKPFYGGTYFPPVDRHGLPGFPRLLQAVARAYRDQP